MSSYLSSLPAGDTAIARAKGASVASRTEGARDAPLPLPSSLRRRPAREDEGVEALIQRRISTMPAAARASCCGAARSSNDDAKAVGAVGGVVLAEASASPHRREHLRFFGSGNRRVLLPPAAS